MRTSHLSLLKFCDTGVTISHVFRFIVMKEWPLFKPCWLKQLVNHFCFSKCSFWKYQVLWLVSCQWISSEANHTVKSLPWIWPFEHKIKCIMDYYISVFPGFFIRTTGMTKTIPAILLHRSNLCILKADGDTSLLLVRSTHLVSWNCVCPWSWYVHVCVRLLKTTHKKEAVLAN